MWTENLASQFANFASSTRKGLHIIAPYIRADALSFVLRTITATDVSIVTTWHTEDVLSGASDLDIYPLCRERGWFMFLHPHLHAKLLVADMQRAIVTSANMTRSGLGLHPHSNVECATCVELLSAYDQLWVARLMSNSQLVNESYYRQFINHIESQRRSEIRWHPRSFDASEFEAQRHFLLSSLPMSDSPEQVFSYIETSVRGRANGFSDEDRACALHDMALFGLDLSDDIAHLRQLLHTRFFQHPFIAAFASSNTPYCFFGEAKAWIQQNCTNVPIPRRRDLTGYVRVLFDWFVDLGQGTYVIERPRYSECLVKISMQ